MRYNFNCGLVFRMMALSLPLFFFFGCHSEERSFPTAPDFALKNMAGEDVTLKQYRGKVVLLDFWATWCPPCRIAVPELVELQEKYGKKGFIILGISMDRPARVSDKRLKRFVQKLKINYPILRYDLNVVENYFGKQAPSLPTMYVIDRKGRVRDRFEGHDSEALRRSLEGLFS